MVKENMISNSDCSSDGGGMERKCGLSLAITHCVPVGKAPSAQALRFSVVCSLHLQQNLHTPLQIKRKS